MSDFGQNIGIGEVNLDLANQIVVQLDKIPNYRTESLGDLHSYAMATLVAISMARPDSSWSDERLKKREKELGTVTSDKRVIAVQLGLEIVGPDFGKQLKNILTGGRKAWDDLMASLPQADQAPSVV